MIRLNQKKPGANGEVNLTPMIDIIFNLLIFFLLVAVVNQKGLNLSLPKSDTAEKRPDKSLEIMVTARGDILFNKVPVEKGSLEDRLAYEKNRRDPVENIILKADEKAPFGLFVKVMDTSRKVGLTNLVIATDPKSDDPTAEQQ